MYAFEYVKPSSLAEAAQLLGADEEAKLMAGGMTYIPTLKQRLAKPTRLVDLSDIAELKGIKEENGGVTVGAMTRHADVQNSDLVRRLIPSLAQLVEVLGDPQVRNRGTIGGSISNNDPAADYPAALIALNATIRTDKREIKAEDFFVSMFETALEPGEIVIAVHFPKPEAGAYAKFRNPASRYAMVGVYVAKTTEGLRVAVTGAGPSVFRATAIEEALASEFSSAAIDKVTIDAGDLNSDMHGSAEYRAHLVKVMAKRAVDAIN